MSNVEDILGYAWNKDAANLKGAIDDVMQSRIGSHVSSLYQDVAASMFSSTNGEIENDSPQPEEEDLQDSIEGTENEDV